jgi:hypothetical protein
MASASGMEKSHVSLIETSSLRYERPFGSHRVTPTTRAMLDPSAPEG